MYPVFDSIAQSLGIAPTLIIVRAGLGGSFPNDTSTSTSSSSRPIAFAATSEETIGVGSCSNLTASVPVQIHKVVEIRKDVDVGPARSRSNLELDH
ncbi:hypothetical protein VNI00_004954 [Paramarasmius palmivorus]|uniref:Uncharacterized protein n=1 Tax=Paramarasmius palmivorus TaxID=297713 RepID=A0AAW0DE79_9AGAR